MRENAYLFIGNPYLLYNRSYTFVTKPEDLRQFNRLSGFEPIDFVLFNKTESFPIHTQTLESLILHDDNLDIDISLFKDIKKFNLNISSLTDRKILKNLNTQVDEFIAKDRKGSIKGEFPGEFLNVRLREVLEKAKEGERAAKKAKKLLLDERFAK